MEKLPIISWDAQINPGEYTLVRKEEEMKRRKKLKV